MGLGVLAIQNTQWIGGQTTLAIFIQYGFVTLKVCDQPFLILSPRLRTPDGIELEGQQIAHPQGSPHGTPKQQKFNIEIRCANTKGFNPNLVKLALPTLLRALIPKHRSHVPQFLGCADQVVLYRRPNTPSGAFRAKRQTVTIAVFKGVHFFFDDVSDLADRSRK